MDEINSLDSSLDVIGERDPSARGRCELSGRPKGYYRKVKMSRIALRSLSNFGQIPGMTKASW